MPYKFTKPLAHLNKLDSGQQAVFLQENFAELTEYSPADVLTQLIAWLASQVNSEQAMIDIMAGPMHAIVKDNLGLLKAIHGDHPDLVASFLVEVLRCQNFKHHDSATIQWYVEQFRALGIPITGDVDQCIDLATFADLTYTKGTVIMRST